MTLYYLYVRTRASNGMYLVGKFTRYNAAVRARHHVRGLIDHQVTEVRWFS